MVKMKEKTAKSKDPGSQRPLADQPFESLGRPVLASQLRPERAGQVAPVLPAVGRPGEELVLPPRPFGWDWFDGLPRLKTPKPSKPGPQPSVSLPPAELAGQKKSKKDDIFEAALTEFARQGFEGARMDRIASQAGCNKALLHYYFKDKESLYETVLTSICTRLITEIGQAFDSSQEAKGVLGQVADVFLDFFHRQQRLGAIALHELLAGGQRLKRVLTRLNQGLLAEGPKKLESLKPTLKPEVDPAHLFISIVGMCLWGSFGLPAMEVILDQDLKAKEEHLAARRKNIMLLLNSGAFK